MNSAEMKAKLTREAEAIQFDCPDEVRALYEYGIIPSGQGAYGQAFSTMVFVEGDFRALAYYNVLCLTRLVGEELFSLEHMRVLFKEYVLLSVLFLKTCGFEKPHELATELVACLDQIDDKEEARELLELYGLYVGIYHQWVHNFMPWHLGEMLPQRRTDYFKRGLELCSRAAG